MSAIIIDGAMAHYEALGRGRPVVFLHGWVGSWRYWINPMQVASTSFRAYALDLFGFGDTAHEVSKYSLESQAGLVNSFLEEMGIGKVALVGHGLGALVAFTFLKQYPKNVDRVMAINFPLNYEAVNARLRVPNMQDLTDLMSSRSPDAAAALLDAPKSDPQAVSASLAGLQASDLFASIRNLLTPCLFVYGESDPLIAPPQPDRSLPMHMRQINLENIGHFPMLDNPNQFNRLLTDFLTLPSGASPAELQMKEEWKRRVR